MITDYFETLAGMHRYCGQFKEWVIKNFFTRKNQYGLEERSDTPVDGWTYGGHLCYHPRYQQHLETIKRCIQICHVFGITRLNVMQQELMEHAHRLGEPEMMKTRKNFEDSIDFIVTIFSRDGFPIGGMISQLHATESERLLEAIHCLFEGCRYSAIAMAASAIEFRLLEFMKQVDPNVGEGLDRKTLGSLIDECLNDSIYAKKLPRRHRPLLELCNEFRIFSVHPKTESITQNEAISVINLAFSFILDERLRRISANEGMAS